MLNAVTLAVIFCLFPYIALATKPIEIIIKGDRYESIDTYRAFKQAKAEGRMPALPVNQHIEPNPSKESGAIADQVAREFKSFAVQSSVEKALVDFRQNWSNPKPSKNLSAEDIEETLRQAAGDSEKAVLVVANPKRLRVMALNSKDQAQ